MKLCLKTLLEFYDQSTECNQKCSNAVNALLGEELGLALLQDCVGEKFRYLNHKCLEQLIGGGHGKRLDAWIGAAIGGEKILFQSEIKNWNVHSVGGKPLEIEATPPEAAIYRLERWNRKFEDCGAESYFPKGDNISKVLRRTQPPEGFDIKDWKIRPLLIFWEAKHPNGEKEALFKRALPTDAADRVENFGDFEELWVFSMSNHIRNLRDKGVEEIVIEDDDPIMLLPQRRIFWLNKISPS